MGDLSVQMRTALVAFASEHQQQGKRLRDLMESSPQSFLEVVRGILLEARDTPETRYLVALLSSRGMLVGVLRDVARLDRGAAGVVAHIAQRMDPGFERTLARSVLDDHAREEGDPEFLLGMVETLTGGFALLPLLGRLRHSPNARVRAKLAGMLGKAARVQEWFNELRTDPDARVRANAIESLWTSDCTYSTGCFESAIEDPNHRVAANALVGMHLQGDTRSIRRMVDLAHCADAGRRAAAVWAMGRSGDPRFLPLLRELRRSGNNSPMVIRHALQSITKIRQAQAATVRRELRVRVMDASLVERPDGTRWEEVTMLARDAEAGRLVEVRDTAWAPEIEGAPVWDYEVSRTQVPPRLGFAFLLPARAGETGRAGQWLRVLDEFFVLRRKNDVGAVQFYSEDPRPRYGGRTGDILRIAETEDAGRQEHWEAGILMQDQSRLLEVVRNAPAPRHLAEGPLNPLVELANGLAAVNGGRHVVLVLDEVKKGLWNAAQLEEAGRVLHAQQITLHVLALAHAPVEARAMLGRLSEASGGMAIPARTLEELAGDARDLLASLYCGYRLRFPESGPGRRRAEVHETDYEGHVQWNWKDGAAVA